MASKRTVTSVLRLLLALLLSAGFALARPWDGPRVVSTSPSEADAIARSEWPRPAPEIAASERASMRTAATWTRSRPLDRGPLGVTAAALVAVTAIGMAALLLRRVDAHIRSGLGPTGRPPNRSPPLLAAV